MRGGGAVLVRRKLRRWELAGFAAVCAAGLALLGLRGGGWWAAVLPASGSVWERMKALYLPYLLFTLAELPRFADPYRNFFAAKAAAGLAGLATLPLLWYTASGALGSLPPWGGAVIFCLSAAALFLTGTALLNSFRLRGAPWQWAGCALLLLLAGLFVRFSFAPPALPLFHA